ncbi:MAG: flagellar motor switch protein FliN [Actinomycetota bacterium]|nr:flagellar motor switch protein FliN [Actinomycetota bacterium]
MSTPSSPLENALVLALEAIERVLRSDFPDLAFTSPEVVEATDPYHGFLLSGPFATNGGTLAIGVEGETELSPAIQSGAKQLKAALAEDMTAAIGQDVAIYGKGAVAEDAASLGPAVKVTVEGIEPSTSLWVAVGTMLGDIMDPLVAERLAELEAEAEPEPAEEPEAEVEAESEEEPEAEAPNTDEPAAQDPAPEDPAAASPAAVEQPAAETTPAEPVQPVEVLDQPVAAAAQQPAPAQPVAAAAQRPAPAQPQPAEPVEVLTAVFPQMGAAVGAAANHDMSLLSDVQLAITVELGRTTMRVRDLLELGAGSVVELDRSAGTPVDVLVNGTIVARGEVVVVDDELGVRVTEVVHNDAGVPT